MSGTGLHRLAIDAAEKSPNRVAVAGTQGTTTYAELDRAADGLARRLRAAGVGRGDRVVVWSEKSAATIAAMQAALRLGAAYVPAELSTPVARVTLLAEDCAAAAIVCPAERFEQVGGGFPTVAVEAADSASGVEERIDEPVEDDDLAYILYTSGSTGRPKGVCLSHRNALSFTRFFADELDATAEDRFSSHAPFTFDLSVLDLYVPFAVGGSVHLVPPEGAYAPAQLVDLIHEQRITVWYSVPSALSMMIRDGGLLERAAPDTLRAVLFAGEPFPIAGVRALAAWTDARLLNLYGPTETNVCTYHEVAPADLEREQPVPIGRACCGDLVRALTEDGREAGPGEEGALHVDGPTVMLGYWGRAPRQGPYATGDLVRVRADGAFDYLGRGDHMVKVRGHRVELGEVEAALAAHEDVAEAAATVTGAGMESRLIAFVTPREDREPGVLGLRRHLAERLPRYLMPDELRILPGLPRNANGKVDRTELARRAEKGSTP
ncbi:MAG TPA: amino acid adenylation domain-containing protein [Actinospica sp.]|nr:amino acid adenylation domain-containing protein [Actinospica sp.]